MHYEASDSIGWQVLCARVSSFRTITRRQNQYAICGKEWGKKSKEKSTCKNGNDKEGNKKVR